MYVFCQTIALIEDPSGKKKLSYVINLIELKLYMNTHWMVPYTVLFFVDQTSEVAVTTGHI
jgi:hypothetical protein